jgi:hypothetical protein
MLSIAPWAPLSLALLERLVADGLVPECDAAFAYYRLGHVKQLRDLWSRWSAHDTYQACLLVKILACETNDCALIDVVLSIVDEGRRAIMGDVEHTAILLTTTAAGPKADNKTFGLILRRVYLPWCHQEQSTPEESVVLWATIMCSLVFNAQACRSVLERWWCARPAPLHPGDVDDMMEELLLCHDQPMQIACVIAKCEECGVCPLDIVDHPKIAELHQCTGSPCLPSPPTEAN